MVFVYIHDVEDRMGRMGKTGNMGDKDDKDDADSMGDDMDADYDNHGIVLTLYHHLNNSSYLKPSHNPLAFASLDFASLDFASYGTCAYMDMYALVPSYVAYQCSNPNDDGDDGHLMYGDLD